MIDIFITYCYERRKHIWREKCSLMLTNTKRKKVMLYIKRKSSYHIISLHTNTHTQKKNVPITQCKKDKKKERKKTKTRIDKKNKYKTWHSISLPTFSYHDPPKFSFSSCHKHLRYPTLRNRHVINSHKG